jgi:peptidoglycan/LPS O-acetylase OafA/YrhL
VRYIPELDGLRAIAVTSVILYHASAFSPVPGGFIGVDLFFVLSAFLISGVLENQSLGTFYVRRFLRLTPALYFLLTVSLLISPTWPMLRDVAVAGLYLSDYGFTFWNVPANFGHTWSLAVEEHFYLLWPFILPQLRKSKHPGWWLSAAYVLLTLWRLPFASDLRSYYFRFDTHSTGLIAGAWLYFVRPKISAPLAASGAALFGVLLFAGSMGSALIFLPPAEIASVILIGWAAQNQSRLLSSAPLVHIGKLSYAMYLWHCPIAYSIRDHVGFWPTLAISFVGSFVMATISWHTVEAMGRKMRHKLSFVHNNDPRWRRYRTLDGATSSVRQ